MQENQVLNPQSFDYPTIGNFNPKHQCIERIAPNHNWDRDTFPVGNLEETTHFAFLITCGDILQTSSNSAIRIRHGNFLYHLLGNPSYINLPRIFYSEIITTAMDKKGETALPYARFITSLLKTIRIQPPTSQLS